MKSISINKMIVLLLVCSMLVLLIGCTNSVPTTQSVQNSPESAKGGPLLPKNGDKFVIGFSNSGLNHPLFSKTQEYFEQESEKNNNIKVVLTDAALQSDKQISDVESLISQNVDLVVIIPNDSKALSPSLKSLNKAGIPVITLIRSIEGGEVLCNIGADDYLIGRMAADYIATMLEGKGKVINLEGTTGASTATLRSKGFQDVINNYPNIEIVATQSASYQRAKAIEVMEGIIATTKDFDAVWCTNDEQAGGAIQALQASNLTDKIIVGCNFQKDGYERLISGTQAADITFPPTMGSKAVEIALKYFSGEKVDANVQMTLDLITKGNAEAFKDTSY